MPVPRLIHVWPKRRRIVKCFDCGKPIELVISTDDGKTKPFDLHQVPIEVVEHERIGQVEVYEPTAFHRCKKRQRHIDRRSRPKAPSQERLL